MISTDLQAFDVDAVREFVNTRNLPHGILIGIRSVDDANLVSRYEIPMLDSVPRADIWHGSAEERRASISIETRPC